MKPIQIISQDVFDKIRSRFQNLEMGDETGAVTIDPATALFFDFDFVNEGINLGRVSISLNDAGSLKVYYSQGITENQDEPAKKLWYAFLKEMRLFAMRRLLRFDTRDIAKTNLDKNDFQYLATKGANKEQGMSMNESRWNQKSSKKTSRAVRGGTEVIVRHHKPVDEDFLGSRSQKKNIKAIFIQNRDGERFKYPFIHPAGAFAMAQHVDHGGVPHDPAGKAIVRMSEQIAQLQEFGRQINHASLHDDAMQIGQRAYGRLQELKAQIESLGKRHHYESWVNELNAGPSEQPMLELDPVTMETYKQKFTQTNFKEELSQFFPLIHSIMSEENEINLEDYVREDDKDNSPPWDDDEDSKSNFKKPNNPNRTPRDTAKALAQKGLEKAKSPAESIDTFEEWAEAVEQNKLTDDEISTLKQALDELETSGQGLQLGPEGQTAWQFFNELGIDDTDLEDKLKDMANIDDSTNPLDVFQAWAQESYPELLVALGMSGTEPAQPEAEPAAAPEAPAEPAAAPAPEAPVAEDPKKVDIPAYLRKQKSDGKDDSWRTTHKDLEKDDERNMSSKAGFAKRKAELGIHEGGDSNDMIREIAKCVKSYYNKDNPEVGPFRGEEGIAIEVGKKISEKFGESAGQQAEEIAKQFMEKLSRDWEQRHGSVGDDGLARLKELVGNIKQKVEGIGDQGQGGKDFNTNIMPAEEKFDPLKHVKNPTQGEKDAAKDVKRSSYADRAAMLRSAEKDGRLKSEDAELESVLKLAGLAPMTADGVLDK
jgi:hypothetical protein